MINFEQNGCFDQIFQSLYYIISTLAVAAQNAVTTIVQLSEVVKSGASSLGSPNREAQVMLINAVKDVASALADLMQSTKAASGKNIHDPAMHHLKESAKVSGLVLLH